MSLRVIKCIPGDFGGKLKGLEGFLLTGYVIHDHQ